MATRNMDLHTCQEMLLDAENSDAKLIQSTIGSTPGADTDAATGLAATGQPDSDPPRRGRRKKKTKNKDEEPVKRGKSAKFGQVRIMRQRFGEKTADGYIFFFNQ